MASSLSLCNDNTTEHFYCGCGEIRHFLQCLEKSPIIDFCADQNLFCDFDGISQRKDPAQYYHATVTVVHLKQTKRYMQSAHKADWPQY